MNNEVWKWAPGYEGLYMVSSFGNIKSLKFGKERLIRPGLVKRGYLSVVFTNSQKTKKCWYVHRLVWEAFNGTIPEGMQVNHINEDKMDNRLVNLNLMTPKENINWGTANNRRSLRNKRIGILQCDLKGNIIQEWPSINSAKKALRINGIYQCLKHYKYRKTAGGFVWKFK